MNLNFFLAIMTQSEKLQMRANIKNKDILRQCLCEIINHEFNRNINGIVIDSRKIEDNDIYTNSFIIKIYMKV